MWYQQVAAGDASRRVHDHVHVRRVQAAGGRTIEVLGAERQAAVGATRESRREGGLGGADGRPGVGSEGGGGGGDLGRVLVVGEDRLDWKGTAAVLALGVVLAGLVTLPTHGEVLVRIKDGLERDRRTDRQQDRGGRETERQRDR